MSLAKAINQFDGLPEDNKDQTRKKKALVKHSKKERLRIAKQICGLYATGHYTIEGACNAFGIPYSTFIRWTGGMEKEPEEIRHSNPYRYSQIKRGGYIKEVREAYAIAREHMRMNRDMVVAERVETALIKAAIGYEYEEETKVYTRGVNGTPVLKEIRKVKKVVPPNVQAMQFYLRNRAGHLYSDEQKHEVKVARPYADLSDEDLHAQLTEYEEIGSKLNEHTDRFLD